MIIKKQQKLYSDNLKWQEYYEMLYFTYAMHASLKKTQCMYLSFVNLKALSSVNE